MSKEFKLGNYKIEFSDEFVGYNNLRKKFVELGNKAFHEFVSIYRNECSNMDEVHNKALDIGYNLISKNIDEAIAVLISNDLMHIDKDVFMDKYYSKFVTWENDFEKVDIKYREIVMSAEEDKAYRESRKNNRSRWQGAGFGLSGAVQASIDAGAMNIASGVAHSVFNSIGNAISNAYANSEKEDMFKDESIIRTLATGVLNNVFFIHYALTYALRENGSTIDSYTTADARKKSDTFTNNLKTGLIPVEKEEMLINEVIHSNPYNEEVYIFLLKKYGDKNRGIEEISEFLNLSISNKKKDILSEYYNGLPKDTEEKTIRSLEDFKIFADKMNITDIQEYMNKFNEILKQHDINIRTVDGILFDTREESTLAVKEYNEIITICSKLTSPTEKSVRDAIEEVNKFKTVVKDKYLAELNKKLIETIRNEEQTFLNNNYSVSNIATEEAADKAIVELEAMTLRNMDLLESRINEIKEKRRLIIEEQDKSVLEDYFNSETILDETDVQRVINNIRNFNIRTDKHKDSMIESITKNKESIIRKFNDLLDKATKYEIRINTPKQEKKPEKKGMFGFISKAIEKGADYIDGMQEKKEKEAWDIITKNGTRTLEGVRNRQY